MNWRYVSWGIKYLSTEYLMFEWIPWITFYLFIKNVCTRTSPYLPYMKTTLCQLHCLTVTKTTSLQAQLNYTIAYWFLCTAQKKTNSCYCSVVFFHLYFPTAIEQRCKHKTFCFYKSINYSINCKLIFNVLQSTSSSFMAFNFFSGKHNEACEWC